MSSSRLLAAGAVAGALALPASAVAAQQPKVVASGLNNPRQVSIASDGTVYVATAGTAGPTCSGTGQDQTCIGRSGAIVAVKGGKVSTLAGGLISAGGQDGTFTAGSDGVSAGPDGRVVAVTTSSTPTDVAKFPKKIQKLAGKLFQVAPGPRRRLASIDAFEWKNNVDGVKGDNNSNPYAVLAQRDRDVVVDAGANDVLQVRKGRIKVLAVIPKNGKAQPVPTSIAQGPDGSLYVGEFVGDTAAGSTNGTARVFRIPAAGGKPKVVAKGFTAITGLAVGKDRTLYVTEATLDKNGQALDGNVVRVSPTGTRTIIASGLGFPAGGALDAKEKHLYFSNFSVLPASTPANGPFGGAGGQLVRISTK